MPVLCCSVHGDEAERLLKTLDAASKVTSAMYGFLMALVATLGGATIVLWIAGAMTNSINFTAWRTAGFDALFGLVIAAGVATVLAPALGLIPWLIRGHRFGFGGESVIDNALAHIFARREPAAALDVRMVTVDPETRTSRWRHTAFFDHPPTVEAIGRWIVSGEIPPNTLAGHVVEQPEKRLLTVFKRVAAIGLVAMLFALRGDHYRAVLALSTAPIEGELRYPELRGHQIGHSRGVLQDNSILSNSNGFVKDGRQGIVAFGVPSAAYCALNGRIQSLDGNWFTVHISVDEPGRPTEFFRSLDLKAYSLHIPLPPGSDVQLTISGQTHGLSDWVTIYADIRRVCWDRAPNDGGAARMPAEIDTIRRVGAPGVHPR